MLIPVLAAVGAGLWAAWANRNRKSGRTGDNSELNGYAAFREAMEKSHSGVPSGAPSGTDTAA
nr:hypothetical protein [Streptomyces typhae]